MTQLEELNTTQALCPERVQNILQDQTIKVFEDQDLKLKFPLKFLSDKFLGHNLMD